MRHATGLSLPRWIESASGRAVVVETGADGRDGTVTYRFEDETRIRTISREAAFLCGYFVAAPRAAAESSPTQDSPGSG